MDIFESKIPNLKIRNYGTRRNPLEAVEASVVLEAWNGYMKNYKDETRVINGTVTLNFGGYNGDKSLDRQPQINAYHHLLENQYAIRDSILRALSEEVDKFTQYLNPDGSFVPNVTPETRDSFDFKPFIGPASVSFDEEESKNGIAYLQWHFDCAWDSEHGLAAITHEDRVIDLDGGETDIWKIYADNGTLAERKKEYDDRAKNAKPPKPQKPWWQFW